MVKFVVLVLLFCASVLTTAERTFSIDYERDTFLKDGQPFRYVSGSAHYFRMPRQYWRDRLRKMRAAGLNAVSTYVEWSLHEKSSGQYDFDGDRSVVDFVRAAEAEGLFVILRPGPYICAEREMGGLPFWLLQKHPDIYLRSRDPKFTKYANRWLQVVFNLTEPLLYGNGGPIILVQVENEFGSYTSCDRNYTASLRDLFKERVGSKAVLFTTDGGSESFLKCGKVQGVYATVDFGPGTNVTAAFAAQRKYEPRGPLVNSEFYPGWLTHWGEGMAHVSTASVVQSLREMLSKGANVNFYMFYGGTNFGFTAGANFGSTYQADITSYDYDAPLSEAGDLTLKYQAIKEVVMEFMPGVSLDVFNSTKGDYGAVHLKATASLFAPKVRSGLGVLRSGRFPQTFESLGQNHGYLLYETVVSQGGVSNLTVGELHDFGTVFVNQRFMANLSREEQTNSVKIPTQPDDTLAVMVENLGRINYGSRNNDTKGILTNVTLDGTVLEQWNFTSFDLGSVKPVEECFVESNEVRLNDCFDPNAIDTSGFVFYMAKFVVEEARDTYIDMSNLVKGVVFVNGVNLGRFWTKRGPQYTLYCPGVWLKVSPEVNTIVIMDEYHKALNLTVNFRATPLYTSSKATKLWG